MNKLVKKLNSLLNTSDFCWTEGVWVVRKAGKPVRTIFGVYPDRPELKKGEYAFPGTAFKAGLILKAWWKVTKQTHLNIPSVRHLLQEHHYHESEDTCRICQV